MSYALFEKAAAINSQFEVIPSNISLLAKGIVIDKNGYLYMRIKIAEPNKWQMLHAYIWEHKHGEIPKGHCVIFKDKNTLNTRLDNLMLISRVELVRLNQKYTHIHENLKETALQVIKISNEIRKNTKK